MKLSIAQKWRRTLIWLRREFPAQHPVTVRSRPLKKLQGETEYRKDCSFYVRIRSDTSLDMRIDTILHEWAHCLAWFGADQEEFHSGEWGLAYAKIYKAFLEWNFGREKK